MSSELTTQAAFTSEAPTPADVQVAFADLWGDMGPAWNVTPSVARVHGYLLASGGLNTERQVREALGLSHRAASLALEELQRWRLVERVDDHPRETRPGPLAHAWRVVGDRWRWFQRVAEVRRAREADPLQPRLEACLELADLAMTNTRFEVRLVSLDKPAADGLEAGEFYLAANAGEAAQPLARIASGGELSRIML
ncbi:MAG: hypothetical protein ACC726_08970, partial [Chloroflexota bacterium]